MEAGYCVLVHGRVCSVMRIYWEAASAAKCTMRLSWVLNTALDLAAAALCIAWRVGGS